MPYNLKASCKDGFILSQFTDKFSFEIPKIQEDVLALIIDFYKDQHATCVSNDSPLKFTRGKIFWSIFNFGGEKYLKQEIVVHISNNSTQIDIEYNCKAILFTRISNFYTLREVTALQEFLCGNATSTQLLGQL